MKVVCINEHTTSCDNHRRRIGYSTNYFVFQYDYKFGCIIYCACLDRCDHLDTKLRLVESIGAFKYQESARAIERGNPLDEVLSERDPSILLQRAVAEVHYKYKGGKEYCFSSYHNYLDYLTYATSYADNYRKAVEVAETSAAISDIMRECVKNLLFDLYLCNRRDLDKLSDVKVMKLTDILNKKLLKHLV